MIGTVRGAEHTVGVGIHDAPLTTSAMGAPPESVRVPRGTGSAAVTLCVALFQLTDLTRPATPLPHPRRWARDGLVHNVRPCPPPRPGAAGSRPPRAGRGFLAQLP